MVMSQNLKLNSEINFNNTLTTADDTTMIIVNKKDLVIQTHVTRDGKLPHGLVGPKNKSSGHRYRRALEFLRWWKAHLANSLILSRIRYRNLKKHFKDIVAVLFFLFRNPVKLNLKYIKKIRKSLDGLIPQEFHESKEIVDKLPDLNILIAQLDMKYFNFEDQ